MGAILWAFAASFVIHYGLSPWPTWRKRSQIGVVITLFVWGVGAVLEGASGKALLIVLVAVALSLTWFMFDTRKAKSLIPKPREGTKPQRAV